jgi:DNA-directed RNA polymerase specialized sigma24 family protein
MIYLKILKQIANRHNDWVNIVRSFGCNNETAEDIVQEMYIKVQLKLKEGLDIRYGDDDFNYSYVFRILRNLFIDLKRKESKVHIVDIDNVEEEFVVDENTDYDKALEKIQNQMDQLFWYDKKVYQIIDDGSSIADLSRKTHIPYYSLYNTFKKVRQKLKKLL